MEAQPFNCRIELYDFLKQPHLANHRFSITRSFNLEDFCSEAFATGNKSAIEISKIKSTYTNLLQVLKADVSVLTKRPILAKVTLTERLYQELAKEFRFRKLQYYHGNVRDFCEKLLPFKAKLQRFAKLIDE